MRAGKFPQIQIPGLASPYRRLVARLIDLAIGAFVIFPLSLIIIVPFMVSTGSSESESTLMGIGSAFIFLLLLMAYDTVMTATLGRTLGKMVLGLNVVDINGDKPGWGTSLLRAVLLYLLGVAILIGIVVTASILGWVFFAGLGRTQQYPHEKASKTYVMTKGQTGPVVEEIKVTPHDDLERLYKSGLISKEEYDRKRKEAGY